MCDSKHLPGKTCNVAQNPGRTNLMTQSLASRSTDGNLHPESRMLFLERGHVARLSLPSKGVVALPRWSNGGAAFHKSPNSVALPFDAQPFRVLSLRRLWLQLPSSVRDCRCGLPLDSRGHHRAACATAGVLCRRFFALESAAARVCREAGARVSLNVRVQDMDLARPSVLDNRMLKMVADGLPLIIGARLAVDTTIVSVLKRDGSVRTRCATVDGASLEAARRRKEATYPELTGRNRRTSLSSSGTRLVGVGPKRLRSSSAVWPKPRQEASQHTCAPQLARLGASDVLLCWRAVPPTLWLFPA